MFTLIELVYVFSSSLGVGKDAKIGQFIVNPLSYTMADIKLTYFDARGRAEPARILLAYGGLNHFK